MILRKESMGRSVVRKKVIEEEGSSGKGNKEAEGKSKGRVGKEESANSRETKGD